MKTRNRLLVALSGGVVAFALTACGDGNSSSSGTDGAAGLSGKVSIDGSSTVEPFAQAAAELFNEENPGVRISVGASGTGGGFEKFCAGEIEVSDASRPIDAKEEVPVCAKNGVKYTELTVANDGIAVVTNPALEISCLTTDQLAQLWTDDKVNNYSDLGDDAETGEPLPDVSVSLYGPGTDSGTFDYFTDEINGAEGRSRSDYQPSEDDNQLVTGVGGDEAGLAYFGFSYYEQNIDRLNLVAVDAGDGCIEPSSAAIQAGDYAPLARPLFMYPSSQALRDESVAGFMQYVVDNAAAIAEAALIVPVDETQASETSAAFEGALG